MIDTASSTWASVCVAIRLQRSRHSLGAVAGGREALTYTPRSYSSFCTCLGDGLQPVDPLGMGNQITQGSGRHRDAGGRDGGGEDVRPRIAAHVIGHLRAGRHVTAQGGEGLGEGAHVDVHLVLQPEVARGTAAAAADHAERVGVVHHDARPVAFGKRHDLGQLRDIAAHREHAVRDDQRAGALRHLFQLRLKPVHVGVVIAQHLAVAELAAVVDRSVVLLVADHVALIMPRLDWKPVEKVTTSSLPRKAAISFSNC